MTLSPLTIARALITTSFLWLASLGLASDIVATYRASDGPVSAVLELNDGHIGKLTIIYTGYLYDCSCGNYSCHGNAVNAVFITFPYGRTKTHTKAMTAECRQPYSGGQEDRTFVSIGNTYSTHAMWWPFQDIEIWRESIIDLAHYYRDGELPDTLREIQVAFEAGGRWDSRHAQNYRLVLTKDPQE